MLVGRCGIIFSVQPTLWLIYTPTIPLTHARTAMTQWRTILIRNKTKCAKRLVSPSSRQPSKCQTSTVATNWRQQNRSSSSYVVNWVGCCREGRGETHWLIKSTMPYLHQRPWIAGHRIVPNGVASSGRSDWLINKCLSVGRSLKNEWTSIIQSSTPPPNRWSY